MSSKKPSSLQMLLTEARGRVPYVHTLRRPGITRMVDKVASSRGAYLGQPGETLFWATAQTVKRIIEAPKDRPQRCTFCKRPIYKGDDYAISLVLARTNKPSQVLSFCICPRCDTGDDLQDVMVAIVTVAGDMLPDMSSRKARRVRIGSAEPAAADKQKII